MSGNASLSEVADVPGVADAAKALAIRSSGFVAPDPPPTPHHCCPGSVADRLQAAEFRRILLLNGIGSAGPIDNRRAVYRRLVEVGHQFAPLIHRGPACRRSASAWVTPRRVLAGAIISAAAQIGDNVLINTAAVVEHGCVIGSHSHVASGWKTCAVNAGSARPFISGPGRQ